MLSLSGGATFFITTVCDVTAIVFCIFLVIVLLLEVFTPSFLIGIVLGPSNCFQPNYGLQVKVAEDLGLLVEIFVDFLKTVVVDVVLARSCALLAGLLLLDGHQRWKLLLLEQRPGSGRS